MRSMDGGTRPTDRPLPGGTTTTTISTSAANATTTTTISTTSNNNNNPRRARPRSPAAAAVAYDADDCDYDPRARHRQRQRHSDASTQEIIRFVRGYQLEREPTLLRLQKKAPLPGIGQMSHSNEEPGGRDYVTHTHHHHHHDEYHHHRNITNNNNSRGHHHHHAVRADDADNDDDDDDDNIIDDEEEEQDHHHHDDEDHHHHDHDDDYGDNEADDSDEGVDEDILLDNEVAAIDAAASGQGRDRFRQISVFHDFRYASVPPPAAMGGSGSNNKKGFDVYNSKPVPMSYVGGAPSSSSTKQQRLRHAGVRPADSQGQPAAAGMVAGRIGPRAHARRNGLGRSLKQLPPIARDEFPERPSAPSPSMTPPGEEEEELDSAGEPVDFIDTS